MTQISSFFTIGKNNRMASSKWLQNSIPDIEKIIKKSIFSSFNDFNPSFEDYIGISHQVQAIQLGYTNF